jgi:hypothetical protein
MCRLFHHWDFTGFGESKLGNPAMNSRCYGYVFIEDLIRE